MAHRLTKVAAAAAVATALIAGGYAIGTRGDGTAVAARSAASPYGWRGDHRHARAHALQALATQLGVTGPALRAALQELRPQRQAARAEHVSELAQALGISEAKVTAALEKLRAQRREGRDARGPEGPGRAHGPCGPGARAHRVAALAKALGLDEADVRSALRSLAPKRRQEIRQRRDAFATALAAKLKLDPDKVKAALDDFAAQRPFEGRHRWRRP
jgi:hypothetical protein